MTPERWQSIYRIFDAAVELPNSGRPAFLDQACGGDAGMRAEIESLLAAASDPGDPLPQAVAQVAADYVAADYVADRPVGKTVGAYEILRPIGAGGMGEVYLARDTRLGRSVALKMLPREFTADPYRLHRFHQEARAASALNHPNILVVHEIGEQDGRQFMATEFVEGRTLRELLAHGPVPVSQILDAGLQVAAALSAAHQAGIVHRDIKPENIMLRPDGYVKVLDFGLAKLAGDEAPGSQARTLSGMVVGTVKYMSPEQARGRPADARSDIFSFGVVLYEMAAGKPPFRGETATDTLILTVQADPVPLTVAAPGTPPGFERAVFRAMSKRPDDRQPSMAVLRDELAALKRSLELHSALAGASTIAVSPPSSPTRRRVVGWTLGGIGAAGIGALATWAIYPKPPLTPGTTRFRKVSTTSEADFGIISPDARYLAYVKDSNGLSSAWVRQLVSGGTDVPLVPAQPVAYHGLTYTPDGNHLYYVLGSRTAGANGTLYRVPALGGSSQVVLDGISAAAAFSPDGARLVFRRNRAAGNRAGLMVANADGSGVRLLAESDGADPFPAYHWRDAGIIQYFRPGGASQWNLAEIAVTGGAGRTLPWGLPGPISFSQMAGRDAIFLVGYDPESGLHQLWYVTLRGRRYRITHDTGEYQALSADSAGRTLLAVQRATANNLWIADARDPAGRPQPVTNGIGSYGDPAWLAADRVVCTVEVGGRRDLWSIPASPGERRQLTFKGDVLPTRPAVSPDGRSVVVAAGHAGDYSLYAVQVETGTLQRVAAGGSPTAAVFTRDGKWLYYLSRDSGGGGLWKVPASGGPGVRLASTTETGLDRSPDGSRLIFESPDSAGIAILDTATDALAAHLPAPPGLAALRWLADDAVAYAIAAGPDRGIWRLSLGGGPAKRMVDPDQERQGPFDSSPDGQRMVYAAGRTVSTLVVITGFR